MNYTQNYSPVEKGNLNGKKFDGTGGVNGTGWVLGEGDLEIKIPYLTNVPWQQNKASIASIKQNITRLKRMEQGIPFFLTIS